MKKTNTNAAIKSPKIGFKLSALCCSVLLAGSAFANTMQPSATISPLNADSRQQIINSVIDKLEQGYIFPNKALTVKKTLRKNLRSKKYKNIIDNNEFAQTLTKQLQEKTGDKHLQVEFSDRALPDPNDRNAQKQEEAFELEMWRAHNFGIEKFERLRFNIGYLKLTAFAPVTEVGPLLASAMNLLHNMDSLIIDLRGNFGGDEQTVQLLSSYFLDERTHLLTMHNRKENRTEQHWSRDYVDGQRFGQDKDLYILIDDQSFSAAEDFSYTMKNLKRATIIGETSGGAANSGDMVQLNKHYSLFLPTSQGISPITKTNWEGTGVTPNIKAPSEKALTKAQIVILEKLMTNEADPRRKKRIQTHISSFKA